MPIRSSATRVDAAAAAGSVAPVAYADLVDLTDAAALILRVQIKKAVAVEPERAGRVAAGRVRLYIEAVPLARLNAAGPPVAAGVVRYLADVTLDERGRVPELKKRVVLVFAQPVADRAGAAPGELRLVAPDAQVADDPALAARVRAVIGQLGAAGAPGALSAVREAIYVPGTLAGAGETQIFLATNDGAPASISVEHAAGVATRWSASFSEVVDASGAPPAPGTLAWYRLACFLPAQLPAGANVSETAEDKAQAAGDYRFVREQLGGCGRKRPEQGRIDARAP